MYKKADQNTIFFSDEIKIDSPDQPGKAQIIAFSVWGILRGMESFGQLIYFTTFDGANEPSVSWMVNRGKHSELNVIRNFKNSAKSISRICIKIT